MFENRSTKIVAAVLRGISLFCIVSFTLLLFSALETGINARSEIQIPLSSNPALFFSDSAYASLILGLAVHLYLSVIFPLAIKNLLAISSLILIGFLTDLLGGLLWRISPVAEKFGEAKEKLLMILAKWRKEKPVRFTIGVVSVIASYILVVILVQAFVLPDLGHYLFVYSQTSFSQWIAFPSLLLLIVTTVICVWFWLSTTGDARRL